MPFRRLTLPIVIAAMLIVGLFTVPAAQAVPQGDNVTRAFCGHRITTSCIAHADDDTGDLTVRNASGRLIHLRTVTAAKRYFRAHAKPCAQEDSNSCFWDAGRRGNRRGHSFITVSGIVLPLWLYV